MKITIQSEIIAGENLWVCSSDEFKTKVLGRTAEEAMSNWNSVKALHELPKAAIDRIYKRLTD